ncbi:helix-turn-helix transcriptional regulator [Lactiplantibacillus nangangensis]|uniref:Helix-turn-helix transcriptional regulator n=1 Tax=Lactiplantibacillus nangangensis TaxID=2559917 RepID=A0ABW1SH48_9LACO|nr:helix-turn-helix transcriptional regulator [Lactiplantibacillus nangangensis]
MSIIYDISKGVIAVNQVKDYRKAAKLTQFELAQAVGVARQTINLVENGKYNPSLDLCIRLAKVLQTDLNQLFWEE